VEKSAGGARAERILRRSDLLQAFFKNLARTGRDGGWYALFFNTSPRIGWQGVNRNRHVLRKWSWTCARQIARRPRLLHWKPDPNNLLPLQGTTYRWIDGVDTDYWYPHWNDDSKGEENGAIK